MGLRLRHLVIGGGINGCGVARDAAGRGYKVLLTEMNDLASGTSSASTKSCRARSFDFSDYVGLNVLGLPKVLEDAIAVIL